MPYNRGSLTIIFLFMIDAAQTIFDRNPVPPPSPVEVGVSAAKTDHVKKVIRDDRKLTALAEQSNRVLLTMSSVFPFDFFPNTVTIDENKVNVLSREFFGSQQIRSVMIKDIKDVVIESSLFFATLKILAEMTFEPIIVHHLKKKQAYKARRIIMGMRMCYKENVDLTNLSIDDVCTRVEDIGKMHDPY